MVEGRPPEVRTEQIADGLDRMGLDLSAPHKFSAGRVKSAVAEEKRPGTALTGPPATRLPRAP